MNECDRGGGEGVSGQCPARASVPRQTYLRAALAAAGMFQGMLTVLGQTGFRHGEDSGRLSQGSRRCCGGNWHVGIGGKKGWPVARAGITWP